MERELGGFKPCAREAREMPRLVSVGEIEEDDDGEVGADLALEGGDSVPLRGHLADQLPPHELVQKQKNDEVLGQIYEFVKSESWPKVGVLRKQFHHPLISGIQQVVSQIVKAREINSKIRHLRSKETLLIIYREILIINNQ